jgi:hypothetical protein
MSSKFSAFGTIRFAASVISSNDTFASIVEICHVSRFENRSTSLSNRSLISSTVDLFISYFDFIAVDEISPPSQKKFMLPPPYTIL